MFIVGRFIRLKTDSTIILIHRSVQSLSNKYTETKKFNIRKNASMYVKSDQVNH